MAKPTHNALLDHEYDGIREYDNPCPMWWHVIFFGSVVFSVFYFVFFHIGTAGWTDAEYYEATKTAHLVAQFAEIGELKGDEATLITYMNDTSKEKWLDVGKSTYQMHCKSCHGADGSGAVGPNLTDDHYKNVKQLTDIVRVVEEGAANGAMPGWRVRLHPNNVVLVSAYVAKLREKQLTGPRGPEGDVIPPWPTEAAAPAEEEADPVQGEP